MGQIVINNQKPKYCNLSAITSGSHSTDVPAAGEIWLIDTTNSSKTNGSGKYDKYIIGDNSHTAAELATNPSTIFNIDNAQQGAIDPFPTSGSNNAVSSNGVFQAIQDVDVSSQISGKANKSEMSIVAGAGDNLGKATITLKEGTSAVVLTQHQDISDKVDTSAMNTAIAAEASARQTGDSTLSVQINTKANKITEVNHGTNDTTFTLTPNVLHIWGEVPSLTLTLETGEAGVSNEYMFRFYSGTTPTVLTLPNSVTWVQPLTTQQEKLYEVSIQNNLAAYITSGMAVAESSGGTPEYATKDWVTNLVDLAPTKNSSNIPTSGGTYNAIEGGFYL